MILFVCVWLSIDVVFHFFLQLFPFIFFIYFPFPIFHCICVYAVSYLQTFCYNKWMHVLTKIFYYSELTDHNTVVHKVVAGTNYMPLHY